MRIFFVQLFVVFFAVVGAEALGGVDTIATQSPTTQKTIVVWNKELSDGRKLSVQLEEPISRLATLDEGAREVTYRVLLRQKEGSEETTLTIPSFTKSVGIINLVVPQPELEMVCAVPAGDDILVAYNLFGRCWAYRLSKSQDNKYETSPKFVYRSASSAAYFETVSDPTVRKRTARVSVGPSMTDVTLQLDAEGHLKVEGSDANGTKHSFICEENRDGLPDWKEQSK